MPRTRGGEQGTLACPWPRPLQPGPPGPCSEEERHASKTESPLPPCLLPLPGSGWGTPIVSLSGSEQTKKRLPGAAGRLTGPSSVSRSADGGASAGLSSPAPLGRRGVLPSGQGASLPGEAGVKVTSPRATAGVSQPCDPTSDAAGARQGQLVLARAGGRPPPEVPGAGSGSLALPLACPPGRGGGAATASPCVCVFVCVCARGRVQSG